VTAAPSPIPVVARPSASPWAVLAVVTVGTFMTTLDASIVNISLPSIARGFGVPLSGTVEWVVIGYLVVIAALLLTHLGRAEARAARERGAAEDHQVRRFVRRSVLVDVRGCRWRLPGPRYESAGVGSRRPHPDGQFHRLGRARLALPKRRGSGARWPGTRIAADMAAETRLGPGV
jgi:hypothetical protein